MLHSSTCILPRARVARQACSFATSCSGRHRRPLQTIPPARRFVRWWPPQLLNRYGYSLVPDPNANAGDARRRAYSERGARNVCRRAERTVLADHNLSWGGFTCLWVLWVWGRMETARLAGECDLAKGTLTGLLTTLVLQQLVARVRLEADRRRVMGSLTDEGRATIEAVFPRFNEFEGQMSAGLTDPEKHELAHHLRRVITNASDD